VGDSKSGGLDIEFKARSIFDGALFLAGGTQLCQPASWGRFKPVPWREFVHQHADQILACDFFTMDTAWLSRLRQIRRLLGGCRARQRGAT
jgi:hypothetical protein